MGITFDTGVRFAEIVAILTGSLGLMIRLGGLGVKVGRAVERFELVGEMQGKEISALKTEIGSLNTIITHLAVHDEKYTNLEKRLTFQQQEINELRHGDGFIKRAS